MEDKNILSLRNRIAHLEFYIKRNLEPTIMSLYMDIDRLNKKIKNITTPDQSEDASADATAETKPTIQTSGVSTLNPIENAIQTMEMLKQRGAKRMNSGNVSATGLPRAQLPIGQSGKVINN
jgi:hypothetical protein